MLQSYIIAQQSCEGVLFLPKTKSSLESQKTKLAQSMTSYFRHPNNFTYFQKNISDHPKTQSYIVRDVTHSSHEYSIFYLPKNLESSKLKVYPICDVISSSHIYFYTFIHQNSRTTNARACSTRDVTYSLNKYYYAS